jgi:hypothetical protein
LGADGLSADALSLLALTLRDVQTSLEWRLAKCVIIDWCDRYERRQSNDTHPWEKEEDERNQALEKCLDKAKRLYPHSAPEEATASSPGGDVYLEMVKLLCDKMKEVHDLHKQETKAIMNMHGQSMSDLELPALFDVCDKLGELEATKALVYHMWQVVIQKFLNAHDIRGLILGDFIRYLEQLRVELDEYSDDNIHGPGEDNKDKSSSKSSEGTMK